MGLTTVTLHLLGVPEAELQPLLHAGDLLRTQNAPWLGVTPRDALDAKRLEKLARKLTKDNETRAAIVFFWFDDDVFHCDFYREGRRRASCLSAESWAKLGKQLNLLYGEDAPAKAFRYAGRCFDLEEQLALLEETVGTALLDDQEAEPRVVPRSDKTLRAIKAREAALRRRPNRYMLTELARPEWPEAVRAKQQLFDLARQSGKLDPEERLLFEIGSETSYVVPGRPHLIWMDRPSFLRPQRWLIYDGKDDVLVMHEHSSDAFSSVLWQTEEGNLVCLFHRADAMRLTRGHVSCLRSDGTEVWRFEPALSSEQQLQEAGVTPDGVITLRTVGLRTHESYLWQLNGETGNVLASAVFAHGARAGYFEAIHGVGVVGLDIPNGEFLVLDENLCERMRYKAADALRYFLPNQIVGTAVWGYGYHDHQFRTLDFLTGEETSCRLEVPVYPCSMLPDGRIFGTNEKGSILYVFDADGIVTARLHVPGEVRWVWQDGAHICAIELRGVQHYGPTSVETLDAVSVHVWRLDEL